MPVRYLSPEWIDAYNAAAAVAADDAVRKALMGKSAVIQMVVADGPAGEVRYSLRIGDGTAAASLGDAGDAEVTIRQSYETAVGRDRQAAAGDARRSSPSSSPCWPPGAAGSPSCTRTGTSIR
jgi:hypothetical protein